MSTMDVFVRKRFLENSSTFKRSLDQIIEKYSKLQQLDGGIEVDLNNTKLETLERHINLSTKVLNKLQSENFKHLSEESLSAQDITRDSLLEIADEDGGDETCGSANQFGGKDNKASLSLLDASLKNFYEDESQPEDQDEELQMSLGSNSSLLVELYPSMVSRLERAWRQQHVSEAADSVLRRYRRWRQQSKQRDLNKTFDATLKHTNGNPKQLTAKGLNTNSRIKRQLVRTEATPHSALLKVTSLPDGQRSNVARDLPRRRHIYVMDFSETHEPKENLLNETFTVCELPPPKLPQQREHASIYTACPSPHYDTAETSVEPSVRLKRLSESSHSSQCAICSTFETEPPPVKERSGIRDSPLRQSPSKSRLMASLSRSPHAFSRSPQKYSLDRCSQEPVRPRLLSLPLSPCPERPIIQPKLFALPQPRSPLSARAADGHHERRRRLSFDSSLSSNPTSYSPKKVDEEFVKLYHKFVCQNKSPSFSAPPCRLCARNCETGRGHASSALAALALSPHRSVLRKRNRELDWDSRSKRLREEHCTSSPGSKRHRREMLIQHGSPSELEQCRGGLLDNPSIHRVQHQEAWVSRHRPASDAHFSGLGGSVENRGASGYFL